MLVVQAVDHGIPALSSTADVYIEVLSSKVEDPEWIEPPGDYILYIREVYINSIINYHYCISSSDRYIHEIYINRIVNYYYCINCNDRYIREVYIRSIINNSVVLIAVIDIYLRFVSLFSFLLFLTCVLTCCPVSILIRLRLNLSTVHNLSLPLWCAITPSFPYYESLAQHFLLWNIMEKVLMPENMSKPSVDGWMDDWINGWLDERMTGWMHEWVDGWLDEQMTGWTDDWMNGWMSGWMTGWMDDWMNGWMSGWMTGWTDDWLNGWMSVWMTG